MTPTEELRHEHKIILLVLQGVRKQVDLPGGPDPVVVKEMVEFFVNFVDRCHHTKEEKHLFPKLEEHGIRRESGPIGVMLHEHEQGRSLVSVIKGIITTGHDPVTLKKSLLEYAKLLKSHIAKENDVLFVMADKVLDDALQRDLSKAFERVEAEEIGEGVHEKYHQLAHRLTSGEE